MSGVLRVVEPGREARLALLAVIRAAQTDDPLAPVTIVTPSNVAALSLRRRIVPEASLVNVRFTRLQSLAEQLGGAVETARGRARLSPLAMAAAIRSALDREAGPLAAVREHPSTVRTLAATFGDLRQMPHGQLEAVAKGGRGALAADTVRVYRRVRRECAERWYDDDDLLETAAEVVSSGATRALPVGDVIVFEPESLSGSAAKLLDAIASRGAVTVLVAAIRRDDPVLQSVTQALPGWRMVESSVLEDDHGLRAARAGQVVSAPDADEEVRTALRLVLDEHGRGTRLDSCAVLYPATSPYARLLAEQLDAAGIPWSGPRPGSLAASPVGRVLIGAVRLMVDDTYKRADVISWLGSGPVLDEHGREVHIGVLDRLSCDAGIVEGSSTWERKLSSVVERRRRTLAEREATPESQSGLERLEANASRLTAFVRRLAGGAREMRSLRTWTEYAAWAVRLLDDLLGDAVHRSRWEADDLEIDGWVRAIVADLGGLDPLDPHPRPARFARALVEALDTPMPPAGRIGRGVAVGPLRSLASLERDFVVVLGATEGTLPLTRRENPLLPLDDEASGSEASPLRVADADRRALELALAGASASACLYPRGDLRSGRVVVPSRLVAGADAPDLQVPSFASALSSEAERTGATDYQLASMSAWCDAGLPAASHFASEDVLARGLRTIFSRAGAAFTRFDGCAGVEVASGDLTSDSAPPEVFSPTRLEDYAKCPMRYLLTNVLRVEKLEGPEAIVTISPLDRGSLMHDVLEQFGRTSKEAAENAGTASEGWATGGELSRGDVERFSRIFDDVASDYERRGLTGKPMVWHAERRRMRTALLRFLAGDARRMAETGYRPVAFELGFGTDADGVPAVEVGTARQDGALGRPVLFRGRIDRIDRGPAGELLVSDYKTGRGTSFDDYRRELDSTRHEPDPVLRGRMLQLPLYALAARSAFEGDGPVRSEFRLVEQPEAEASIGLPVGEGTVRRFVEVVDVITAGIESGRFPARPGEEKWKGPDNCLYCDYDLLCPPTRLATWARKREDAALAEYVALAEGDVVDFPNGGADE